ncbi:MAG: sigma-70 family RNA polymerase sigma factor [Oscillospiraceae bacterium]|nr:sigma-70 family RNA polymerase sigma factor [Oscillospiraceae bacterium]
MKPNYEETVLRYKDMVYRIAFARCTCRQDAEDVFQDVFLKLYNFNGDFSDEEHLKSWLIRVTLNFCKLLYRSAWFRKRTELSENIAETENPEESETAEAVIAAVRVLPEKYRPLVEMYYYEEMSCKEIARALKMNEATVRTRLKRAREKLKRELEVLENE